MERAASGGLQSMGSQKSWTQQQQELYNLVDMLKPTKLYNFNG